MRHRLREGLFLLSVATATLLFISLLTYHAHDPGWSSTGEGHRIFNWGGKVGAWVADVFLSLFGMMAFLFPFLLVSISWFGLKNDDVEKKKSFEFLINWASGLLIILSACGLSSFYFKGILKLPAASGGIIGDILSQNLSSLFNRTGTTLIFITILLSGITIVTGLSWLKLLEKTGQRISESLRRYKARQPFNNQSTLIKPEKPKLPQRDPILLEPIANMPTFKPILIKKPEPVREKRKIEKSASVQLKKGELPPFTLLNLPAQTKEKPFARISFEELSILVEQRLSDFGVEVKVVAVHPGPVVTRFELELAPGIKVSKITGLAKDIARSLSAVSVRVVEVIPGKSVIGLEIPNENRELVTLRDILESQRYAQSRSPVSLVLGKDISGNPVVVDLTKMPHLLVAGTTGSGKSVSLNAMLLSILFKATPEQVRLILIDPKMLELSVYDGIPHLLTPVITDMKDASNALRWCVAEMDKRYRLMASLGVRNITGYNQKVNEAIKQGNPLRMPGTLVTDEASAKVILEPLPLIVVIADELADMMMVVGKKVEDLIARIAQKARAAGIHLILATQRPSVDVITGLIKANIPTRIAFQVSSRIDSRTILDQQGAEQLLGHGDMLYLPPGVGVPIRVHGAFVMDDEVHEVVAVWRTYSQPTYLEGITEGWNNDAGEALNSGEQDVLYDEAVKIVTESRRASISLVQRRLRIGYNRAARMMEDMESAGIVSTMDHSGNREVLAASHGD